LATNPVKVYEYLSAGKPVVSADLPEMEQFGDLVYTAQSHSEFFQNVACALEEFPGSKITERRRAFAANQTWRDRSLELIRALRRKEAAAVASPFDGSYEGS
jgi:glycosyltransferase involved in cell wall biosynthesis